MTSSGPRQQAVVKVQFHRKRERTSAWFRLHKGDEIPDELALISLVFP